MQNVENIAQKIEGKNTQKHYGEPCVVVHIEQNVMEGNYLVIPVSDLDSDALKKLVGTINRKLKNLSAVNRVQQMSNIATDITRVQTYSQVQGWWRAEYEQAENLDNDFKWYKVRNLLSKRGPREVDTLHQSKWKTTVVRYHERG